MIETLSGYLTLVLGVTTGTILVLQYLLAKRHWRLNLYDKRYPVYSATMQYLYHIDQNRSVTDEELFKFRRNSKDKEFLFGDDVQEFLNELYNKGIDLKRHISIRDSGSIAEERRTKLIDEEHELLEWFSKQFEEAKRLFGKYLKIDKR